MYKIFCCRRRNTNRVEADQITDSLEICLSVDQGVAQFKSFLEKNDLTDELKTLEFVLSCANILTELSKLSPGTNRRGLPPGICNEIKKLRDMAEPINFDSGQMNYLRDHFDKPSDLNDLNEAVKRTQDWAICLLRNAYKFFRATLLGSTGQEQSFKDDNGDPPR